MSFLACLGIGTLQAIRDGTLPADVGIWSLSAPQFCEELSANPSIPQEIVEVFQMSDELSALKELAPDKFSGEVEKLIHKLYTVLATIEEPAWRLQWPRQFNTSK